MVVFGRWAYSDGLNVASLLLFRFGIATICLWAMLLFIGIPLPRRTDLLRSLGMGTIYVGNAGAYFLALTLAPAGIVAMLFYLYPAIVTVLAFLFLKEKIGKTELAALIIAMSGSLITIGWTEKSGALLGALLAIISAVFYASFVVTGRKWSNEVQPLVRSALVTTSATVVFVVAALIFGFQVPNGSQGWIAVLGVSLISTVFAITAFLTGIKYVSSTNAATLSASEPVVSAIAAWLILNEALSGGFVIGAMMILTAAIMIANSNLIPKKS